MLKASDKIASFSFVVEVVKTVFHQLTKNLTKFSNSYGIQKYCDFL